MKNTKLYVLTGVWNLINYYGKIKYNDENIGKVFLLQKKNIRHIVEFWKYIYT